MIIAVIFLTLLYQYIGFQPKTVLFENKQFDANIIQYKNMKDYNTIVNFELDQTLHFEDFSLRFTKKRSIPGPNNAKWNMRFFDFEITGKSGIKQLHWSSGTGRIAPVPFKYDHSDFLLILHVLQTNKPDEPYSFIEMNENQLIIQKIVR